MPSSFFLLHSPFSPPPPLILSLSLSLRLDCLPLVRRCRSLTRRRRRPRSILGPRDPRGGPFGVRRGRKPCREPPDAERKRKRERERREERGRREREREREREASALHTQVSLPCVRGPAFHADQCPGKSSLSRGPPAREGPAQSRATAPVHCPCYRVHNVTLLDST